MCKEYLDLLIDMIEELEIPYIFVHSDKMVSAKLCHILWKDQVHVLCYLRKRIRAGFIMF